jgi:hypothetical protein
LQDENLKVRHSRSQAFTVGTSTGSAIWANWGYGRNFGEGGVLEKGFFTLKILANLLEAKQTVLATNRTDTCNPWATRNPSDEARDLYRMMRFGSCTITEIRELIDVPKHVREALLAYAERYPEDSERIHCILHFRERVAEEFERLIEADRSPAEPGQASSDLKCTQPIFSGNEFNHA